MPWTQPTLLSGPSTLSSSAALLPTPSLCLRPLRSPPAAGKPLRWRESPSAWLSSLANRQQSQTGGGAELGGSCFPSSELGESPRNGFGSQRPLYLWCIMESQDGFSWKESKDHLIPAPCCGQGQLSPDQVAPNPAHPGLGHCCAQHPKRLKGRKSPNPSWE